MKLHNYQRAAVRNVRQQWAAGHRRVLLVSPTGSGKTVMAAALARAELMQGGRVLMLCHTREIYAQAEKRLPKGVRLAMVQTLARRGPGDWSPTLVMVDECHHGGAPTWGRVLDAYPDARICGLTATPQAAGMAERWDATVIGALPSELAAQGYLCPVTMLTHGAPDTSRVIVRGGEYDQAQLARVTNVSELRGDVLTAYRDRTPGLPAIGFAVDVAHSKALTAEFKAAGIAAEHIDGSLPEKQRDRILADFASGTVRVLWNCDLLGEGLDIPGAAVCILARPLHSLRLYLQSVGRVRRTGKPMSYVHDHGGNLERHGHPDDDRDYSLLPAKPPKAVQPPTGTPAVIQPRLRLVLECPADAYQIDPALQRLGFTPDTGPLDPSEQWHDAVTEPHAVAESVLLDLLDGIARMPRRTG